MSPKETQTIEWKESWRDEYLRWICGFANARGGTLIIGKNDRGTVLGVANAKRLLEDIPNKIKDILGIIVDVNLRVEQGKDLIEIVVEAYPYPVNYKGEYYYRSGSTIVND
jgi:ATP-dependent DNA helicase RecG